MVVTRARRLAPVLALVAFPACASAPPPPPPPPPPKVDPPPPPPPAPEGRWIARDRDASVGPAFNGGTLVLMGGRRALLKADGSVEVDTGASGPLLEGLATVPTAGGSVLVGWDNYTVYRVKGISDALTPLASVGYISALLTAPGKIVLRSGSQELGIDPETGAHAPFELGTPFAPTQMRFVDMNRGVANFEHAGMHFTSDGGKTWTKATMPGQPGYLRLAQHGSDVVAVGYQRGNELVADFASGSFKPLVEKEDTHAVPRWIQLAGVDVARAVVEGGMLIDDKTVAVVSGKAAALVDLGTLLPTKVWPLETFVSGCAPTHVNKDGTAEIVCLDSDKGATRIHIPVKDAKAKLVVKPLENPGMYVSTSGAILAFGECASANPDKDAPPVDEYNAVCVYDAENKGKSVTLGSSGDMPLSVTDAGPLAGGGAAVVSFSEGKPIELRFPGTKRPPVKLPLTGFGRVNNYIDEDVDGTLRFVLRVDQGRKGVEVSPSGVVTTTDLPEKVRMYRKFAYVWSFGDNEMTMSRDFGKTWISLGKGLPDAIGIPDYFTSDVGVSAGSYVFIGTTVPQPPAAVPDVPAKRISAVEPVFDVKCKQDPKFKPPTKTPAIINDLLKGGAAPKGQFANVKLGWGAVGTFSALVFSGKEGQPANKWTIRWLSTRDVPGAKVREASIAPPKDMHEPWDLSQVNAEGDRLFAVLNGKDHLIARVDGAKLTITKAPQGWISRSVIAYGNGKPIYFQSGGKLYVWFEGKDPVEAGTLHDSFQLGADAKGGVSLLTFRGALAPRAAFHMQSPKPGSGAKLFDVDPSTSFAKWALVPSDNVPFCDAKAKGTRYRVSTYPHVSLDDKSRSGPAFAEVILREQGGPCIATLEIGSYQRDFFLQADFAKKKTVAAMAPSPVGLPNQYQCTVTYGAPAETH